MQTYINVYKIRIKQYQKKSCQNGGNLHHRCFLKLEFRSFINIFFFQCNVISASRTPKLIGDIMDFKFKI